MKNADMPAAPCGKIPVDAPAGGDPFGNYTKQANGLTKRELIAAMAMQGLVADPQLDARIDGVAILAVSYADALLAELEKK